MCTYFSRNLGHLYPDSPLYNTYISADSRTFRQPLVLVKKEIEGFSEKYLPTDIKSDRPRTSEYMDGTLKLSNT